MWLTTNSIRDGYGHLHDASTPATLHPPALGVASAYCCLGMANISGDPSPLLPVD
jgi:hypothetical protein